MNKIIKNKILISNNIILIKIKKENETNNINKIFRN